MRIRACLTVALLALAPVAAAAEEPLDGYFIAEQVCPAYQSFKKQTNPGAVETEIRHAYDMLAINKFGGSHYLIRVPGAPNTDRRWVALACGVHAMAADTLFNGVGVGGDQDGGGQDGGQDGGSAPFVPPQHDGAEESARNVLAASWQPSFCENHRDKPECQLLNGDPSLPAARQFSIHGLWPDDIYCGVPETVQAQDAPDAWGDLPAPLVDPATEEDLATAMPGVLSGLDHHEWIKHGTCYKAAGGADEYYDDTIWLMEQLNLSLVRSVFENAIGERLSAQEVRAAFDLAFGEGAGDRVALSCDDGMIRELQLHLEGRIEDGITTLSELLLAADPVSVGCSSGRVDPAG